MRIISWNVNGIRACSKKGLIPCVDRYKPDVLCLQETKAHPDQLDEDILNLLGGDGFFSSAEKKGYSGTVTFVKPKALKTVKKVEHGIGIKKFDLEGRFVVTTHKNFKLYNVYFPNGAMNEDRHAFKQEFLKKLTKHLAKDIKKGQEVILVGDYNVAHTENDIHDPVRLAQTSGFLPEEREWFSSFLDTGFKDVFREKHPKKTTYTWWSYRERARVDNRGWRIDYICTTPKIFKKIKKVEILDKHLGSDHCPLYIDIDSE